MENTFTAQNEILINPIVLKWARNTIGFSVKDAAKKLKITEQKLQKWEAGDELVPITKLKVLCQVYKRPSVIFLLNYEPVEKIPTKFRNLLDMHIGAFTSDTLLAIRKATRTQSIAKEVLNGSDNSFLNKIKVLQNLNDYEQIGSRMLDLLGVKSNDISRAKDPYEQLNYWKAVIEAKGIYVLEIGFPIDEAKGFAIYDEVTPIIVLNARDYPNSRIFTLMHELSHFVYGKGVISDDTNLLNFTSDDRTEIACNYIAGAILVPQFVLGEKISQLNLSLQDLETDLEVLSKVFNISREVVLRRLLINKYINSATFNSRFQLFKKGYKEKTPAKGGNFYIKYLKNNSRAFIVKVLDAYRVNRISYGEALDYLNIKSETLVKLEARI